MRKGLTQEDEAKFALLEPDGVSPMKRRQMAAHQGKVSQFKGGLVLAFGLIFLLYLAYPRPSAKNAFVAAAEDRKRSSATVSRGESDDIIIPSRATVTGTTLDFRSATSAIADSGDLGDTVVVGKSIISNTADDESLLTRPAVIDDSSASNGEGPSVIRHVAGGDENIDYPPPPPPAPSRGVFRFLNWLRGRKTQGTGRVAALISKLKQEIADGTHFEPGVMGQRLVEIERLERAEAEGEQKRKDAVATAQLEQQVKAAAAQRHDAVSEKMANIESLMTKYGGKHPDLVPQLRQLEKDLAHPDLAHPNQVRQRTRALPRIFPARDTYVACLSPTVADSLLTWTSLVGLRTRVLTKCAPCVSASSRCRRGATPAHPCSPSVRRPTPSRLRPGSRTRCRKKSMRRRCAKRSRTSCVRDRRSGWRCAGSG